ncbi:MAG: hypothetical protein JNL50_04160 [Phycisphaerae bacterium]|nr:hypothetical protein [Phycisphaerae bacterium]
MQFLWRLYQRRIINVNINIAVAGFLAMAPTVGIIHLMTTLTRMPEPEDMSQGQKLFINAMTFIVDIFFDVVIYYGLHWIANHSPWRSEKLADASKPQFLKDATVVQFERACLSPLFYIIALGGQNLLMQFNVNAAAATAICFTAAILVSRVLHTLWMLRQERRASAKAAPNSGGTDAKAA